MIAIARSIVWSPTSISPADDGKEDHVVVVRILGVRRRECAFGIHHPSVLGEREPLQWQPLVR